MYGGPDPDPHDERTPVEHTSRPSPTAPPLPRRRGGSAARAAVLVLLLAACTGGADDPDRPDGPVASPGAATSDAATPAAPAASPLPPVEGGASAECLAGTWQLDLAAMQQGLQAAAGAGAEVVVDGTTTYEFADGGVLRVEVDSTSGVTLTAGDERLTSSSRSTGTLTGTWSLDGDQLVVSDVDTSDLDVTTTATTDDEDVDVPPGSAEDTIGVLPPTLATVGCSADRASLVSTLVTDEEGESVILVHPLHR
ncbi:hypothetical protein Cfla_2760 [Cellulomonas flavigena DSM 20109]|uniref:Lipocalin-like domain-containing protein n=1 Tax=Cellulomonas flavigena (strain ATCC 482 / DSM 20109 / BCRC 11376 / JCM 18109 / NBRC 3775 / NCIMB 8073 / NRS 134) TaxID=446466 RepID=D5UJK7_CELFN|nr:hypothetical protein [Cellulomonas flavigena]ADG75645.1 hypothetical protein Cfla_2760 [Cellulomonas flavigena DSM 20109]